MAGPGALTAMVLLGGKMAGDWPALILLMGVLALVLAVTLMVFVASHRLEKFMGVQGQLVAGRLLGVLLAALAVQYVADGVMTFIRS
jgi:multiple antibiotic resistance protein